MKIIRRSDSFFEIHIQANTIFFGYLKFLGFVYSLARMGMANINLGIHPPPPNGTLDRSEHTTTYGNR